MQATVTPISRQTESDDDWPFANEEPSANWRPGQRRIRTRKSVSHTIRHGVRGILRSVVRRPDFDLPNLTELAALAGELDEALIAAVANLRSQGHSWQAIGDALGVTRQTAFIRFASRMDRAVVGLAGSGQ